MDITTAVKSLSNSWRVITTDGTIPITGTSSRTRLADVLTGGWINSSTVLNGTLCYRGEPVLHDVDIEDRVDFTDTGEVVVTHDEPDFTGLEELL